MKSLKYIYKTIANKIIYRHGVHKVTVQHVIVSGKKTYIEINLKVSFICSFECFISMKKIRLIFHLNRAQANMSANKFS